MCVHSWQLNVMSSSSSSCCETFQCERENSITDLPAYMSLVRFLGMTFIVSGDDTYERQIFRLCCLINFLNKIFKPWFEIKLTKKWILTFCNQLFSPVFAIIVLPFCKHDMHFSVNRYGIGQKIATYLLVVFKIAYYFNI